MTQLELGYILVDENYQFVNFAFISSVLVSLFPNFKCRFEPLQTPIKDAVQVDIAKLIQANELNVSVIHAPANNYHLFHILGRSISPRFFNQKLKCNRLALLQNAFTYVDEPQALLHVWENMPQKTLRDLYLSLPTPTPVSLANIKSLKVRALLASENFDLQTTLFPYQRATVQQLILKERQPALIPEPSFHQIGSIWLSVDDWSWHKEPIYWTNCRGGVLCEDMGTGKTCMCIALICATRHLWGVLPYNAELQIYQSLPHRDGVPTLQHYALKSIAVNQIPWRQQSGALPKHIRRLLKASRPHFVAKSKSQAALPLLESESRRSLQSASKQVIMFPSTCTLVVVPDNLLDQWSFEIAKHCKPHTIKTEIVGSTSTEIPPVSVILKRHVLLLNQSTLGRELAAIRNGTSSLAQIHFQRIIVDEGHCYSNQFAHHTQAACFVSAAYRWVCSGTPTRQILANTADRSQLVTDLRRFQRLCGVFLECDLVAHAPKSFAKHVTRPFVDSLYPEKRFSGSSLPTYSGLERIMSHIMVRNSPEIIQQQVTLPPLYESVQRLPLTEPQCLIYNVLVAFFKVNAVTSEREGSDYLFSPSNREHVNLLINNLTDVLLWHSGFIPKQNLIELQNNTRGAISSGKYSGSDLVDLQNSLKAISAIFTNQKYSHLAFEDLSNGELLFCVAGDLSDTPVHSEIVDDTSWISTGAVLRAQEAKHFKNAFIKSTLSTKFNYLVGKLLEHCEAGEKTIVYCQSAPEMYYVSLLCCVANIAHLIYTRSNNAAHAIISGKTSAREKAARLVTFNTSDYVKVFVMEAQAAAYGIDLCSASRIYFVSPMAHDAMYRQAVKRVHRIGCTKPVHVTTLCVQDSFEEGLVGTHQTELFNEDIATISNVTSVVEGAKRRLIQNTKFIDWNNSHAHTAAQFAHFSGRKLSLFHELYTTMADEIVSVDSEDVPVDQSLNRQQEKLTFASMKLTRAFLQRLSRDTNDLAAENAHAGPQTKKKRKPKAPNTNIHQEIGLTQHTPGNSPSPKKRLKQNPENAWNVLGSELDNLFNVNLYLKNSKEPFKEIEEVDEVEIIE